MELELGAKSTKPGSKATASRAQLKGGKLRRVPVGELHLIDTSVPSFGASYTAVCGEGNLMLIEDEGDDPYSNDRCEVCENQRWVSDFSAMQNDLLH